MCIHRDVRLVALVEKLPCHTPSAGFDNIALAFVHDARVTVARGFALFLRRAVLVGIHIGLRMGTVDHLQRPHLQTQTHGLLDESVEDTP